MVFLSLLLELLAGFFGSSSGSGVLDWIVGLFLSFLEL